VFQKLALRRVINASGTMTTLGASRVSPEVIEAMSAILPHFVEIGALQRAASQAISSATGAEAGCLTASCAAGISLAVAAAMTRLDLAAIERLPETSGLKNEVILQKGHEVNYGANVSQNIRLTGAKLLEIGSVSGCGVYQLRGAIGPQTAAAVFVVSHHTVQSGLIPLEDFCRAAHDAGVPVIVDAASEYDLRGFLTQGADIVLYSAHKFMGGPTAGIIAGRADLVHACYANQERGLGRAMKLGKESMVGSIAALERWAGLDHASIQTQEQARVRLALERLKGVRGLSTETEADPTHNPITRVLVRVNPNQAGLSAFELASRLSDGDPSIKVRDHHTDRGYFLLDPCNLEDQEMELVCQRMLEILSNTDPSRIPAPTPSLADRSAQAMLAWTGVRTADVRKGG
jgi:D-glucosaminate-6-phosphate ammonia-lyase